MLQQIKKVLVLAPHTDDGELGAGATIAKMIGMGIEVHYVAFSAAEDALGPELPKDTLRDEVMKATKQLGIKEKHVKVFQYPVRCFDQYRQKILQDIIDVKLQAEYDLVMLPCIDDLHQDHQVIAKEGVRAFKRTTVWSYELPWNNLSFSIDVMVKVSPAELQCKVQALQAYQSQAHRTYMQAQFTESLARIRGQQAGCEYAEAFKLVRLIVD